jgi:hypothetical protein
MEQGEELPTCYHPPEHPSTRSPGCPPCCREEYNIPRGAQYPFHSVPLTRWDQAGPPTMWQLSRGATWQEDRRKPAPPWNTVSPPRQPGCPSSWAQLSWAAKNSTWNAQAVMSTASQARQLPASLLGAHTLSTNRSAVPLAMTGSKGKAHLGSRPGKSPQNVLKERRGQRALACRLTLTGTQPSRAWMSPSATQPSGTALTQQTAWRLCLPPW